MERKKKCHTCKSTTINFLHLCRPLVRKDEVHEVDVDEAESAADGEDAVQEGVAVAANDGLAHAGVLEGRARG